MAAEREDDMPDKPTVPVAMRVDEISEQDLDALCKAKPRRVRLSAARVDIENLLSIANRHTRDYHRPTTR